MIGCFDGDAGWGRQRAEEEEEEEGGARAKWVDLFTYCSLFQGGVLFAGSLSD